MLVLISTMAELQVRSEVEAGIQFLLEGRERDPYKDVLPRLAYEYSWGGKQAPTFKVPNGQW